MDERNWKERAKEATQATGPGKCGTKLGAILLAVLGQEDLVPCPRFKGTATISSDGFVFCDFQSRDNAWHVGAFVCDVDDLRDNFRGLADHLKLTDSERDEMFVELLKWISVDYRAINESQKVNQWNGSPKLK